MDAVLREYFWAIIRNKLIVEVTHEDGTITILKPETLAAHLASYSVQDKNFAKKLN